MTNKLQAGLFTVLTLLVGSRIQAQEQSPLTPKLEQLCEIAEKEGKKQILNNSLHNIWESPDKKYALQIIYYIDENGNISESPSQINSTQITINYTNSGNFELKRTMVLDGGPNDKPDGKFNGQDRIYEETAPYNPNINKPLNEFFGPRIGETEFGKKAPNKGEIISSLSPSRIMIEKNYNPGYNMILEDFPNRNQYNKTYSKLINNILEQANPKDYKKVSDMPEVIKN
jgi:hypothetical protein